MQACMVDTPIEMGPQETDSVPKTLSQALAFYSHPYVATMTLARARWGEAVECLHCHSRMKHFYISTRRIWKCRSCRKQFSPKAGTIFEDSPIGLDRWLAALWIVANSERRVGSYKLHRFLGVTQTTAQFMLRRIYVAMAARKTENAENGRSSLATGSPL